MRAWRLVSTRRGYRRSSVLPAWCAGTDYSVDLSWEACPEGHVLDGQATVVFLKPLTLGCLRPMTQRRALAYALTTGDPS